MGAISIISPALCLGFQVSIYLGGPLNLNASVFSSAESWQERFPEKDLDVWLAEGGTY